MRNGDSSDSDDSYEDRKRKCKMKLQTPLMMTGRRANPKKNSSFGKRGNSSSGKRWLTFLLRLEQRTYKQHCCLHYTSAILCTINLFF